MKIKYENKEGINKVNTLWPKNIGCTHCNSFLAVDKEDVVGVYYERNTLYFLTKCPCCELLTDFG